MTDKSLSRALCAGLFMATAVLAGCSVMSKDDCAKANWRELGRQDAERGHESQARFNQRAQACTKAGVGRPDPSEYMAGHAVGQTTYCTAALGRADALGGLPPSAVCRVQIAEQAYRAGYDDALQRFCTAKGGFDYGRKGGTYRNTCPPDWADAFETGYRLGHEIDELNRRLVQIDRQRADERKILSDPKSTPGDRAAANRRLGQLDGDEAAVRQMIRQAEITGLSIK